MLFKMLPKSVKLGVIVLLHRILLYQRILTDELHFKYFKAAILAVVKSGRKNGFQIQLSLQGTYLNQ
jgi:hypothetical protein